MPILRSLVYTYFIKVNFRKVFYRNPMYIKPEAQFKAAA